MEGKGFQDESGKDAEQRPQEQTQRVLASANTQAGTSLIFSLNSFKIVSRVDEETRFVNVESGNACNCMLKRLPRQMADGTRELIFNVVWSYMILMDFFLGLGIYKLKETYNTPCMCAHSFLSCDAVIVQCYSKHNTTQPSCLVSLRHRSLYHFPAAKGCHFV